MSPGEPASAAEPSRLARGDLLAAAGGAVLLISMFLTWFRADVSGSLPGVEGLSRGLEPLNAWQAFDVIDIVLFVVAVLALAHAAYRAAGALPAWSVDPRVVLAVLGLVAAGAVVVGLADPPIEEVSGEFVQVQPQRLAGGFIALAGALAIAVGGWLGSRGEARGVSAARGGPARSAARD
jgi:hypothetical protein